MQSPSDRRNGTNPDIPLLLRRPRRAGARVAQPAAARRADAGAPLLRRLEQLGAAGQARGRRLARARARLGGLAAILEASGRRGEAVACGNIAELLEIDG
ncbi:MAG TPA: hypothetical protein VGQ64_07905 [Candidatus Limnocylindrales bacterium]|nr:hypothetical protein [Candidatus Limnocylindrales bacterium]